MLFVVLTLFASIIGIITGFGVSTFLVPVLIIWWPFKVVVVMVGIIHLVVNGWKVALFHDRKILKKAGMVLIYFGSTGLVGSICGAYLVSKVDEILIIRLVGLVLVTYFFIKVYFSTNFPLRNPGWIMVGGGVTGIISGLVGIGGPIIALFLHAQKWQSKHYLFLAGILGIVIDASRLSVYLLNPPESLNQHVGLLLLALPMTWVGAVMAKRVLNYLPEKKFQQIILCLLLGMGVKLIIWPGGH